MICFFQQSPTPTLNSTNKDIKVDSSLFFTVYGCLCASNSVFTLFRAFLFASSGILAGKHIHRRLIDRLSKASLNFYQSTPSGRILNRLSSDMYAIDDSLPFILNIFLANLFALVGMLSVTCYSLPWFTVSLLPLSILYHNIQSYYRCEMFTNKRFFMFLFYKLYYWQIFFNSESENTLFCLFLHPGFKSYKFYLS